MDKNRTVDAGSLLGGFVLREETRGTTLILGGCHVGGQYVGRDAAFPLLLQRAGEPLANDDCLLIPGVSVRIATRKARQVARTQTLSRVILQIGHRETIRASRLPTARARTSQDGGRPEESAGRPISSIAYAKATLLGLALRAAGADRLTVPAQRFEARFSDDVADLFQTLAEATIPEVVVLSCFPTAKSRLNRKRLIANAVLRAAADRPGFRYVDVWSALSYRSGPLHGFARRDVLSTPAHLNAEGHRLVADAIALALAIEPPVPRSFRARRPEAEEVQASAPTAAAIAPASRAPR